EHPHRAPVAPGEQRVGHGDGQEDDDPAHRRRARLGLMALRPLLADVLAELAVAQEVDELRAQEQAHQQRGGAGDQHPPGCRAGHASSSLAPRARQTSSRPTPRDALTSTTSPGASSSGTMVAASAASETACVSPWKRSAIDAASGPTVTSTSTPTSAACSPSWAWKSCSCGPSSSMSPSTATRREPSVSAAVALRSSSAARMEIGLAL